MKKNLKFILQIQQGGQNQRGLHLPEHHRLLFSHRPPPPINHQQEHRESLLQDDDEHVQGDIQAQHQGDQEEQTSGGGRGREELQLQGTPPPMPPEQRMPHGGSDLQRQGGGHPSATKTHNCQPITSAHHQGGDIYRAHPFGKRVSRREREKRDSEEV